MCFGRISEETATFALSSIKRLAFITEMDSVYSAVRTESLNKTYSPRLYGLSFSDLKIMLIVAFIVGYKFTELCALKSPVV
jgi:hypothetical protein